MRHTDHGAGPGHTLFVHAGKFGGILNGVDYDTWNPEVDRYIPQRYSAATLDDKHVNARVLREGFMLRDEPKPIAPMSGALSSEGAEVDPSTVA